MSIFGKLVDKNTEVNLKNVPFLPWDIARNIQKWYHIENFNELIRLYKDGEEK